MVDGSHAIPVWGFSSGSAAMQPWVMVRISSRGGIALTCSRPRPRAPALRAADSYPLDPPLYADYTLPEMAAGVDRVIFSNSRKSFRRLLPHRSVDADLVACMDGCRLRSHLVAVDKPERAVYTTRGKL
jgi:hypothetical protein